MVSVVQKFGRLQSARQVICHRATALMYLELLLSHEWKAYEGQQLLNLINFAVRLLNPDHTSTK